MCIMIDKAQANPKRIVFPEGDHGKILRACHVLLEEKIAIPVLLGHGDQVQKAAADLGVSLDGAVVIDPATHPRMEEYVQEHYRLRQRKGVSLAVAREQMNHRSIFSSMMMRMGDADALVSGVTKNYPDILRPALQIIGVREGIHKVSGIYFLITRKGDLYFFADATVDVEPTTEDLAEIVLCTAQEARRFDVEPRVAMLSFSNFGSSRHPLCDKVRRAVELVRYADPRLMIDGEVQADFAINAKKLETGFPFSRLKGGANVLIFPDLQSCNIAARLITPIRSGRGAGSDSLRRCESRFICCNGVRRSRTSSTSLLSPWSTLRNARRLPKRSRFQPRWPSTSVTYLDCAPRPLPFRGTGWAAFVATTG
jgi:malate dehydrogenase (oxaloacetate-decarboxylating)(NADP+)